MTIAALCFAVVAAGVFVYCVVEYSLFVPAPRGLRVLMYHKVTDGEPSGLAVSTAMFERQCRYVVKHGYTTVTFGEVLDSMQSGTPLPAKPLILAFDDGYRDFAEHAFPILKRHGLRATVFVVAGRIGQTNTWDRTGEPLLGADEMRALAGSGRVEFGLHSFEHGSYGGMSVEQMREDLTRCKQALDKLNIPWTPVLAFPYGAFPRRGPENEALRSVLREQGIRAALRIGQRVNRLPLRDPYELKRAKIGGREPMLDFTIKLRKGRRKLFA